MQRSIEQVPSLSDEELVEIATEDEGTYPDDFVLAIWEQVAARGISVELAGEPPDQAGTEELVTIATFQSYVEAQFAQGRLLASGIRAHLSDENTIRMNWFWANALGGIKLRVPATDAGESLEILRAPASPES